MKAGGPEHQAGWCDGNPASEYPCGHAASFFARNEDTPPGDKTIHACGKHLAAQIAAFPIPTATSTRFIVVPCNPNIERLTDDQA